MDIPPAKPYAQICLPPVRRRLRIFGLLLPICLAINFLASLPARADYTTTADASITYQTIAGWGTSLCWWANVVGGYPDPARDNYITAFFDPVNGLGLNVVRYNIGGGENPIYNYLGYRDKVPGFEPSVGVYNWTADANQRWVLQQAIAKGANVIEAFSNSPPYWMTISGSVTGASGGGDNLQPADFGEFADYLTTVVQHYRDSWGITFNTLEAMNEPSSSWWSLGGGQEGCHFDQGEQATMITDVGASLQIKGLKGTMASAPDDNQTNQSVASIGGYDSITLGYIGQINTHDYTGSDQVQLNAQAVEYDKNLHMSEYGDSDGSGLTMSYHILNDMRLMPNCTAFVYWQTVDNASGWGFWLNGLSDEVTTSYTVNEKYYVMGNYSKFIRPGYHLISITDSDSLAAESPDGQTLVIVTTCGSTAANVTYNLTNFGARSFTVTPYQTSSSKSLAALTSFTAAGNTNFTYALPANSVTTFVFASQSPAPTSLVWTGGTYPSGSNVWDNSTTNLPWVTTTGSSSSYQSGDTLLFDDTSADPTVNINAVVSPGLITVNSSVNAYTLANGTGGSIGTYYTSTALLKTGASILSINGSNNYAGATNIEEGGVISRNPNAFGTGTVYLNNGTTLTLASGVSMGNALSVSGTATFNTGPAANTFSGALTGANAALYIAGGNPLTLQGSMAGYSGLFSAGASGVQMRLYGNTGSGAADFDLGTAGAGIYPRNGNITVQLGSLAGAANTSIGGPSADSNPVNYTIGGDNHSATFYGQISGSSVSVTKSGTGVETLAGVCSYTGATTVSSGTLLVSGTLGNTPVTVAGGTLSGAGVIGSGAGGAVISASNGMIAPGNTAGAGGALTIGDGLSLTQSTLAFGLSNSPAANNSDGIILTGGTLSVTGTQSLVVSEINGNLTSGTYTLISGGGATALSGAAYTTNLPTGSRQAYALQSSPAGSGPAYLQLVVTGVPPASLVWKGTGGGGTWDTETTSSWSNGPTGTFYPADTATFNDTSTNGNITISGTVAPAAVMVGNNSTAYTFGGTGSISGATSLLKTGAASLTISGSNTYTGGTFIDGGSIILANSTANTAGLGAGSVTLDGGTLVLAGYGSGTSYSTFNNNLIVPTGDTGTLDVTETGPNGSPYGVLEGTLTGGGTLNMSVYYGRSGIAGDWSEFTGQVNVTTPATGNFFFAANYGDNGMPGATINLGNNVTMLWVGTVASPNTGVTIGAIAGTASSVLQGGNTGGRSVTWSVGGNNASTTFAGAISEQGSSDITALIKQGTGTWTLSGKCTYNGTTLVSAGTLVVSGTINSAGAFEVQSGASLNLAGGSISTPTITLDPGSTCTAYGAINAATLINNGSISVGAGHTLTLPGNVVNNGTMSFTGGAALSISGTFTNNGVLDLLTGSQTLPANLANYGTIINSSSVKVISMAKSASALSVNIQSYSGHTYTLQSATALTSPSWQTVTSQAGNGSVLTLTDPSGATGAAKFYRVSIAP
jgi:autotransporter-associated beta strand protein